MEYEFHLTGASSSQTQVKDLIMAGGTPHDRLPAPLSLRPHLQLASLDHTLSSISCSLALFLVFCGPASSPPTPTWLTSSGHRSHGHAVPDHPVPDHPSSLPSPLSPSPQQLAHTEMLHILLHFLFSAFALFPHYGLTRVTVRVCCCVCPGQGTCSVLVWDGERRMGSESRLRRSPGLTEEKSVFGPVGFPERTVIHGRGAFVQNRAPNVPNVWEKGKMGDSHFWTPKMG